MDEACLPQIQSAEVAVLAPNGREVQIGQEVQSWPRVRATVSLFACSISGGLVVLPHTFQSATLLLGLAVTCGAAFTTFLSLFALAKLSIASGVSSYGEVCELIGGRWLKAFVDGTIGFFLTGVLSGSLIVVKDWFGGFVSDLMSKLAVIIISGVFVFPMALPRDISKLAIISSFALCAFLLLILVLVISGFEQISHVNELPWSPNSDLNPQGHLVPLRLLDTYFPVITFACGCQFQLMDIFKSLPSSRNPDKAVQSFIPVIIGSTTAQATLFSLTGLFGAMAFPNEKVDPDIIKMLHGTLGGVARAALSLAVTGSAPLTIFAARGAINTLALSISGREVVSNAVHIGLTVGVVVGSVLIAVFVSDIMTVFSVLGAFICGPLFFILPAASLIYFSGRNLGVPEIIACAWLLLVGVGCWVIGMAKYLEQL